MHRFDARLAGVAEEDAHFPAAGAARRIDQIERRPADGAETVLQVHDASRGYGDENVVKPATRLIPRCGAVGRAKHSATGEELLDGADDPDPQVFAHDQEDRHDDDGNQHDDEGQLDEAGA